MQLDQTHIAIRERGFLEIMGLALQVTRAHFVGLTFALLVGVAPFFALNCWMFYDWADSLWAEDYADLYQARMLLVVVVAIEAPFATALVTLYLGQITFSQKADARTILGAFFRALPQLTLLQGIVRTALMPVVLLPYWYQPYLGELILLERNPLFGSKRLTTMRRSRNLHSNSGGDLFGRWLLAWTTGKLLVFLLLHSVAILWGSLLSIELNLFYHFLFAFHGVLWLVFGWMAVVRFLSYLDMRIRHEGWEVELLMRAEAQRLRRTLGMASA